MRVEAFLTERASRDPGREALVCDGRRYTYGDLAAMAGRMAQAWRELGVRRGDRVLVQLPNGVEALAALFGTLLAGGAFVPVHPSTRPDKLAYLLADSGAVALATEARALDPVLAAAGPGLRGVVACGHGDLPEAPGVRVLGFDAVQAGFPAEPPPCAGIDLDLACLIYTSGSTGEPKGVMCDHAAMDFVSTSIMTYLGNTRDDVILDVLPLSFDYGLYQPLMAFKAGARLVLERSFLYPGQVLRRLLDEGVTGFPGVPTLFALLLQMDWAGRSFPALRYLSNTAAALPPSHILQLRERFPGARLFSMYGLTETKRCLYLPPDQLDLRPGSVGVAIPGTEVWLEDAEGRRLGPGEVGELVVRGRHVMRGYWNAPEASAARFRPGPLPGERVCHTGDLFRMDADGYLYFVARMDDIIKSRGEKVAPREVENVLHLLPGVSAAVVGVPDPVLGEAVKAVVATRDPDLTVAKVLAHCRAHLEDHLVPTLVELRAELPLTASGKVDRLRLR